MHFRSAMLLNSVYRFEDSSSYIFSCLAQMELLGCPNGRRVLRFMAISRIACTIVADRSMLTLLFLWLSTDHIYNKSSSHVSSSAASSMVAELRSTNTVARVVHSGRYTAHEWSDLMKPYTRNGRKSKTRRGADLNQALIPLQRWLITACILLASPLLVLS